MAKGSDSKGDKKTASRQAGLELLEKWILQLMDQGIDVLQRDQHRIEDISTRLVDFGMPGMARKIRNLPQKTEEGEDWKEIVLRELGECYLACIVAKKNIYQPVTSLQHLVGTPQRKSDVEAMGHVLNDQWLYAGSLRGREEKMTMVRNWFIGMETGRVALFIEFLFNRFSSQRTFQPGHFYKGPVYFYPGKTECRVTDIPKNNTSISADYLPPAESLTGFLDRHCQSVTYSPFLRYEFSILREVRVVGQDGHHFLREAGGEAMKLKVDRDTLWDLTALLLDPSVLVAVEWEGGRCRPLACFSKGCVIPF